MAAVERKLEEKKDAKKTRAESRKAAQERADFRGFVNFKPNDTQKASFKEWFAKEEAPTIDTEELLSDGWKIGFARDKSDGIWVATIARWDVGHPEAGIILNCRTNDVLLGHLRVVYALAYVYEGELSSHVAGEAGDDLF